MNELNYKNTVASINEINVFQVGVIGNSAIALSLLIISRRQSAASNNTSLFLASLCMADLLFLLLYLPMNIWREVRLLFIIQSSPELPHDTQLSLFTFAFGQDGTDNENKMKVKDGAANVCLVSRESSFCELCKVQSY